MSVRNSRVAAFRSTAAGDFDLYTVPTGFTFLMKSVVWQNWGTPGNVLIHIFPTGSAAVLQVANYTTTSATTSFEWSGWVALNAGDRINGHFPDINVDVMIGGAVLPFNAAL